jgi:hypothetical protein
MYSTHMNTLTVDKRTQVIAALVEGNSIRSTVRMTGAAKRTVQNLGYALGVACREYQDKTFMDIPCKKIQCDEIWAFCGMKEKNVPKELKGTYALGDAYTYVALCPDCKLVPWFLIGKRDPISTEYFIRGLARRINHRVQITTDGYNGYRDPIMNHFAGRADFSQLVKIYTASGKDSSGEVRYSPPECSGTRKKTYMGNPDPGHVSTSLVERQNLTTRLTNAFSKKIDNLRAAVALHFFHYNFCRVHKTLGVTPAMKAGYADHVWSLTELVELLGGNSNSTNSK